MVSNRLLVGSMAGFVLAMATAISVADTIEVQAFGLSFTPADIIVQPGDTIRWTGDGVFHTITTGTNCGYDNGFFNEPIFAGSKIFEWVVPETEGVIDYFCAPHCALGMVGTITVDAGFCLGDANEDGMVDIMDLLGLLSAWETDSPAYDFAPPGGDQWIDVQDLLAILGAWGDCA